MSIDVFTYSNKVLGVDRIEFGILGNDEIKRMSVIPEGINKHETYNNFDPIIGGLVDTRLGITDPNLLCGTCGLDHLQCVGHNSYVELVDFVHHTGFLPYVKKILSCICIRCSKLLVYKNEKEIEDMLKNKMGYI